MDDKLTAAWLKHQTSPEDMTIDDQINLYKSHLRFLDREYIKFQKRIRALNKLKESNLGVGNADGL